MNQLRRITKRDLNEMVYRAVNDVLNEEMEESWLSDKWKQTKSAFGTALKNTDYPTSIKDRFSAAKKNWNSQGELNGYNNLLQQLSQFIDDGKIDPSMTVAELVGGKYSNGKMGKLTGRINNRKSQISGRGGRFYQE